MVNYYGSMKIHPNLSYGGFLLQTCRVQTRLLILGCGFEQLVDQNIGQINKWCGRVKCGLSKVVDERTTTGEWWWSKHKYNPYWARKPIAWYYWNEDKRPFPPLEQAIVM